MCIQIIEYTWTITLTEREVDLQRLCRKLHQMTLHHHKRWMSYLGLCTIFIWLLLTKNNESVDDTDHSSTTISLHRHCSEGTFTS